MQKTKPYKAWVAGIGATLTALSTALATVSVALGDDRVDASEVGAIATAAAVLVTTVYAVWQVPNPADNSDNNTGNHRNTV
jgi:hypothetical protein